MITASPSPVSLVMPLLAWSVWSTVMKPGCTNHEAGHMKPGRVNNEAGPMYHILGLLPGNVQSLVLQLMVHSKCLARSWNVTAGVGRSSFSYDMVQETEEIHRSLLGGNLPVPAVLPFGGE